jgi:HlyD family type I secretion membrane fusion protein
LSVDSIKPKLFEWKDKRTFMLGFAFAAAMTIATLGLIGWFSIANLEESVTGYGQITPIAKVRRVMSPLDGVVVKLNVQEDSVVKAGQVLMELNPEITDAEGSELKEQLSYLNDEVKALQAARGEGRFDGKTSFGRLQSDWLDSVKKSYESKLASAKLQVNKSDHLYKESRASLKQTQDLLQNEEDSFQHYKSLYQKGGIAKKDVDDKEKEVIEVRARIGALEETVKARKAELEQSEESLSEIKHDYNKELLEKIADNQKEINHIRGGISKNQISQKRQIILAPVDGTVNEQSVKGLGEVISAGQVLVSLVPDDSEVFAEVKVANRDLSYVHINQKAALRIDAFPYNQFGRLEGTITAISPSTSQDKDGNPYYLVRIKPEKSLMSKAGVNYQLKSGMTLRADIITRKKNIVSVFTEPMQEEIDKAFRDPVI